MVDWAVSGVNNVQAVFKIKGDGYRRQEKASAANLKELLAMFLPLCEHVFASCPQYSLTLRFELESVNTPFNFSSDSCWS
jgi:hypothetical protein